MHALLSDPGGTAATGQSGIALLVASVLPSAVSMASAPTRSSLSGLNPTAYMLAVYASPPGLPLFDARLASGWWPTLAGRDSNPLGPFARFQLVLHGILLAQASPGAPKLELRTGQPFPGTEARSGPACDTPIEAEITPRADSTTKGDR